MLKDSKKNKIKKNNKIFFREQKSSKWLVAEACPRKGRQKPSRPSKNRPDRKSRSRDRNEDRKESRAKPKKRDKNNKYAACIKNSSYYPKAISKGKRDEKNDKDNFSKLIHNSSKT